MFKKRRMYLYIIKTMSLRYNLKSNSNRSTVQTFLKFESFYCSNLSYSSKSPSISILRFWEIVHHKLSKHPFRYTQDFLFFSWISWRGRYGPFPEKSIATPNSSILYFHTFRAVLHSWGQRRAEWNSWTHATSPPECDRWRVL